MVRMSSMGRSLDGSNSGGHGSGVVGMVAVVQWWQMVGITESLQNPYRIFTEPAASWQMVANHVLERRRNPNPILAFQ